MPATLFGDVTDTDLARAAAVLAHYSRRSTDRPLAAAGFNSLCEAAVADDRLGELGLALCAAMEDLRPHWFTDDETAAGWAALAAQPIPPVPP